MIVTLTPNPSVDRTFVLDGLDKGRLNRARSAKADPGGKGVNVAVALAANGYAATAVVPAGGPDGDHLAALLRAANVGLALVPISSEIRSNITLVEDGGSTTKVNAPGPELTPDELDLLHERTVALARNADWVVACGSLPMGADSRFYARLVGRLGCNVAVDTTGVALLRAIEAEVEVVKPNLTELREATGETLSCLGDVIEVAQGLKRRGAGEVVVSLGRHGAVSVGESVVFGSAVVNSVVSTVGAGDALLAGYLAEQGSQAERLSRGLAWAAASCETSNTEMPTPGRIARQQVNVGTSFDAAMEVD